MKTSIDIVIPIFNEEDDLRHKITELNQFLSKFNERWNWKISIFDNGSIDDSERIGLQLESNSLIKLLISSLFNGGTPP